MILSVGDMWNGHSGAYVEVRRTADSLLEEVDRPLSFVSHKCYEVRSE